MARRCSPSANTPGRPADRAVLNTEIKTDLQTVKMPCCALCVLCALERICGNCFGVFALRPGKSREFHVEHWPLHATATAATNFEAQRLP